MCGIAGAMVWTRSTGTDASTVVRRMVETLGHRGPDGQGVKDCTALADRSAQPSDVAFGHTRLAILDLSPRGAQPMQSVNGSVWITFNGEIYNFAEIRGELEREGRTFRSGTDTEVILQGYEQWGAAVIERLRGMFAFAIWDGRVRRLLLARDRFGIKPLYLYQDASGIFFASEVRALLASGVPPRKLDPVAVGQFLAYQTVAPPRTLIAGITMLRPGEMLVAGDGPSTIQVRQYWDLLDAASPAARDASPADARASVRRLLGESAALHLVSDVPIGVFLSGGIDSSAIVSLTAAAGITPRTFTVTLPGSTHDEAPFARAIACRFGADHHEIDIDAATLRRLLPMSLAATDHPSGDGFNTFVVSHAVCEAGFKVALSGLGGDELFGGYPSFRRLERLSAYAPVLRRSPRALRQLAAAAVRTAGGASVASSKTAAVIESNGSVAHAFPVLRQLFSPAERRALLSEDAAGSQPDPYRALLEDAEARHPDADVMSLVTFAEARTYMHDVLLRDSDQMSMAHGLEIRVPLLDHRLAEYVMGLSADIKTPRTRPKQLLIESLGNDLPAACVDRPKQGFVLPFDDWMRGELRTFCEEQLGPAGLGRAGLFNGAAVTSLWRDFLAGSARTSWSRPWSLVSLGSWISLNRIGA